MVFAAWGVNEAYAWWKVGLAAEDLKNTLNVPIFPLTDREKFLSEEWFVQVMPSMFSPESNQAFAGYLNALLTFALDSSYEPFRQTAEILVEETGARRVELITENLLARSSATMSPVFAIQPEVVNGQWTTILAANPFYSDQRNYDKYPSFKSIWVPCNTMILLAHEVLGHLVQYQKYMPLLIENGLSLKRGEKAMETFSLAEEYAHAVSSEIVLGVVDSVSEARPMITPDLLFLVDQWRLIRTTDQNWRDPRWSKILTKNGFDS